MCGWKCFLRSLCFGMVFMFCAEFFRYLLIDDTTSYTRIMMHELYNQNSNIDILFVGSSHCYRSFVPDVTDEIFQKNTFNGGSSSQELDGSLMLIKEAVRDNDIQQIYLEVYYYFAFCEPYKERVQMTDTYILSDYMKPSIDKIMYLLNASSKEHYVNSFILARRNWEKIFEFDYMYELLKKKRSDNYRKYAYADVTGDTQAYMGKGYVLNNTVVTEGTFWDSEHSISIDMDKLSADWKKSLSEIIDFCNHKNIELTLVTTPMSNFKLTDVKNYDEYINLVNELIEGTGVKYYDFNLCKEAYIPNDDTLFKDADHLNCYGAELFSNVFSKFFTGQISEEELFYDSYNEKLYHLEEDIFGIVVKDDLENHFITIEPVTNASIDQVTYRVFKNIEDGKTVEIRDVRTLSKIFYPEGESGTFEIMTYLYGEEKNHVSIVYGE